MLLKLLQAVLFLLDWLCKFLFPGIPTTFSKLKLAITYILSSDIIYTFRSWTAKIFYFIPYAYVKPLIECMLVFLIFRIIFALFRVITDLL